LVVVVAESNVRQRTPDVFFQAWIIDKGITIVLNTLNSFITICFLFTYLIIL
jgi:hypothetical protein